MYLGVDTVIVSEDANIHYDVPVLMTVSRKQSQFTKSVLTSRCPTHSKLLKFYPTKKSWVR